MTTDEINQILQDLENEINKYAKEQLKSSFRLNANPILLRRFNNLFKYDGNDKPREWPQISEEQIKEIFDTSKVQITEALDQFKLIDFPLGIAKYNCNTTSDDHADPDLQAQIDLNDLVNGEPKMEKSRSDSI